MAPAEDAAERAKAIAAFFSRAAAEFAQACLARGECKEEDVDLHMGWRLAKWSKQMRLHYSDRGVRTSRAHLTELI